MFLRTKNSKSNVMAFLNRPDLSSVLWLICQCCRGLSGESSCGRLKCQTKMKDLCPCNLDLLTGSKICTGIFFDHLQFKGGLLIWELDRLKQGVILSLPGNVWPCLETFFIVTTGRKVVLEPNRWRPDMLLNMLQCTGQLPHNKELTNSNCQ